MSKANGNGDGRTLGQQHFDLTAKRQGIEAEIERLKAEVRRADERCALLREEMKAQETATKAAEAEATSLAFKATAQGQRNERLAAALDEIEKVLVTHNLIDTENGETLAQAILRAHNDLVEAKATLRDAQKTSVSFMMNDGETIEQCLARHRPEIEAAEANAARVGKRARVIVGSNVAGTVSIGDIREARDLDPQAAEGLRGSTADDASKPETAHVAPPCAHFAKGKGKVSLKDLQDPQNWVTGHWGVAVAPESQTTEPSVTSAHETVEVLLPRAPDETETVARWRAMFCARYDAAIAGAEHVKAFDIVARELKLLWLAATGDDSWLDVPKGEVT